MSVEARPRGITPHHMLCAAWPVLVPHLKVAVHPDLLEQRLLVLVIEVGQHRLEPVPGHTLLDVVQGGSCPK